MTPADLKRAIQLHHVLSDRLSQKSYRDYLRRVRIDCRPTAKPFGEVAEPWQWDRVSAIEGAIEHVAGVREHYDGPRNIWLGYSKGHDKTSFIARTFNWLLGYSKRRIKLYACAGDRDQAALIRDAMAVEANLNPWLQQRVKVLTRAAWGPGGNLEIIASDADSGQGKIFSVAVFDELSHWKSKEFFDAIYSARNKRPEAVVIVLTNAGFKRSWAYDIRELARNSPRWHFFEQPVGVQLASWMDAEAIAEDAKMLLPTEFRRLIRNEWIDEAADDPFVTSDEAEACVLPALPVDASTRVGDYYAGVDYGPKRDRTALCLLHRESDGKLVIDHLHCWHRPGGLVYVEELEAWVEAIKAKYGSVRFVCDSYQLEGSIQKWEQKRWDVTRFEPRGGKSNYELAANLRSLITSRRIGWLPTAGTITLPHPFTKNGEPIEALRTDTFASELSQLIIRATGAGYRIDHTSGRHDDRSVAVGMAALAATNDHLPTPFVAPEPLSLPNSERDLRSLDFSRGRQLYGG